MVDLTQIVNYYPLSDRFVTAGMPTREQLGSLGAAGFERVINLAVDESPDAVPDEAGVVRSQGLDYVHIPVVWEHPRLIDLRLFMDAMDDSREKKVFVHCVLNMRVSAFVFLYRVIRLKEPIEKAVEDMSSIWTPYDVWKDFLQTAMEYYRVGR